jgi:nucleotide-binding universal stress UspA family protein
MKNILLLIHDDSGQEARLQAALDVTRAIDGHLTCLDVSIVPPLYADSYGVSGGALMVDIERETEASNKARIAPRLVSEGIPFDWHDATAYLEPALEQASGLADLIVVNRHLDSFPLPDMRTVASSLVVKSGRPILAVPERVTGFRAQGAALVAWDGSPEASDALTAAVPLLALAGTVTILAIDDGSINAPVEEAAAYLSRHDIHAVIVHETCDSDPGAILVGKANCGRYAYMVMGGFGHSRCMEAMFGGVTRALLTESEIPLFLAH